MAPWSHITLDFVTGLLPSDGHKVSMTMVIALPGLQTLCHCQSYSEKLLVKQRFLPPFPPQGHCVTLGPAIHITGVEDFLHTTHDKGKSFQKG